MASKWLRASFIDWKFHYCSADVLESLAADAQKRFAGSFIDAEPVSDGAFLERPGMVLANRGYQHLHFDGLDLTIPVLDFTHFQQKLSALEPRLFPDGSQYYKLHSWLHCLVLTPEQRRLCLEAMVAAAPEAEARAEAENKALDAGIQAINRDGLKVISRRDPESLKAVEKKLVSKPDCNKN